MTTLHEARSRAQDDLTASEARWRARQARRRELLERLSQIRSMPTVGPSQETETRALLTEKRDVDTDLERLETTMLEQRRRVAESEHIAREEADNERLSHQITPSEAAARMKENDRMSYDQVFRVGAEARTYRPDFDRNGEQFLLDLSRAFIFNDPTSTERLQRHAAEERVERAEYLERAVGTGAFAGLTVPQYLTDLYAPATAALRPFADNCTTQHPLSESGMTVNISRITTSSSVALQASENATVSETDMDDTLLTINVQTAAGSQTVSRQAIERGTGIEEVTLGDLFRRYATALDSTLITQATTGLDALAQAVSYVDATPTTAELWPKLFDAQNKVETALLAQAFPTHHVMHPRRWNWICSQVGSTWPTVSSGAMPPQLFAQVLTNEYGNGPRAILNNGMVIVTDANIATNLGGGTEDAIYTVAKQECHLWEDPKAPVFIRAEQPKAKSLGVDLVVYGYFAYTFGRYANAAAKIGGTGLAAPTF